MQNHHLFANKGAKYEAWFKINDQLYASELAALKALIPHKGKGVEIGVGTGIFASALGIRQGVEPSENMASKARKKGIQVIKGSAENLPLASETYAFALMVTVDCFLEDVAQAFAEVHRILVDHGVLIIAFLDRATSLGQRYEKNKHLHNSYKNATFHSAAEIATFLRGAGFKIVDNRQTIYTLKNEYQEVKAGVGEGLFAVIKAKK